jgi:hypothetical protein
MIKDFSFFQKNISFLVKKQFIKLQKKWGKYFFNARKACSSKRTNKVISCLRRGILAIE